MAESESESDEGLELPGCGLVQDVAAAEAKVNELYDKANLIRDDLRNPLQEGEVEGGDPLAEKLQEIRERLLEKRPKAWRAERGSFLAPSDGEDSSRPCTPVGTSIAELEAELDSIQARRKSCALPPSNPLPSTDKTDDRDGASESHSDPQVKVDDGLKVDVEVSSAAQKSGTPKAASGSKRQSAQDSTLADLKEQLSQRDTVINDLSAKIREVETSIRKEFKTDLQALRQENKELHSEREELDRQIISLKLDKEEAEHRLAQAKEEADKMVADVREEVKKTERARIQTAAAQLQKELAKKNQQKIAEVEQKLNDQHAQEKAALLAKIADLEGL